MQQVRPNREPIPDINVREREGCHGVFRTDLSSLLSEYTTTQKRYNDRLESLEREIESLKAQPHPDALSSPSSTTNENELNRTYTTKKASPTQPTSARGIGSSRIPLPVTPRKSINGNTIPVNPSNTMLPNSRPLPPVPLTRSKTFHNDTSSASSSPSDDGNLLRSYKAHLEQILRKDSPPYSDIRIPNYTCIEDVLKANEQLLIDNDRLRSELNRLKTESTLLLRSMKTATGIEPTLGNERIIAERERQELTMELARQAEENKRLRKSLLAQSEKFLTLRQSTHTTNIELVKLQDHRCTPGSAPQASLRHSKVQQSNSSRYNMRDNRAIIRAKSFHHSSQDSS
ncbi:unnamed protein product [Rotaria magnacalcarata]|uniref:Uncharacterized protein n=1 Tax=Rotaria magnacalcarata TaxID=392030 RepID=A0A816N5X2_9BILA|nr:unnamed protein product [Rotaria magnacalcarata]CAF2030324.1 unnamed protein product [Rotaria magnacalcarata]CAF3937989.1 unnamed protein product [Rotaria magnacalcarata]CAF4104170.1 unnamed protein product [Rotaria magnacalcarata]